MQLIPREVLTQSFMSGWQAAGHHLQEKGKGDLVWLRTNLHQPMTEHLSFRLGNQLYFVFVDAVENDIAALPFDSDRAKRLSHAAEIANAVPCLIRINKTSREWSVSSPEWGLVHAETGEPIDPPSLVDDQPIEMTDWELHDFAVQVVSNFLTQEGKNVTEWQSILEIDPTIWFEDGDRFCWVVVRTVRYPEANAPRPENLATLTGATGPRGRNGYFASVAVANGEDPFDGSPPMPLYRGCGMYVSFTGIEPIRDAPGKEQENRT